MLEEELGVQLFKRGVRHVLLTDSRQLLWKSELGAFAESMISVFRMLTLLSVGASVLGG